MKLTKIRYSIYNIRTNKFIPDISGKTGKQAFMNYFKKHKHHLRHWKYTDKLLDPEVHNKRQIQVNTWNDEIIKGDRVLTVCDCISLYYQGVDVVFDNGTPRLYLAKLTHQRRKLMYQHG